MRADQAPVPMREGGPTAGAAPRPLLVAVLLLLTACGAAPTPPAGPTPTAPAAGVTPTATAVVAAAPTAAPGQAAFQNPVLASDFPDPDVIQVGPHFYAFATQGAYGNVQTAQSDDLVHWQRQADAMRILATWIDVGQPNVWAPGVVQVGSRFLLFYTARDSASGRQCIGLATATEPLGPYRDQASTPFLCQFKLGGSIDPMPLADGGKLYLYWKNDGNCCGITTQLFGQELSADGAAVQGDPVALTETNAYWEGNVIEGPDMVHHGSGYYLFFSANDYRNASYGVGYAACDGALGPCTQAPENPILASRIQTPPLVIGPGGETVIQDGSQTWMLYHAWNVTNGVRGDYRYLWLDPLVWVDGKPVVEGPTTYPEPVPPTPEATP